jgi:hypothetical protein
MEKPTTEKPEVTQTFARDQAVSINSFFDVEIEGETVRLQITTRNGADTARIVSVVNEHIGAYTALRQEHPRTVVQVKPATAEPVRGNEHKGPQPVPASELPAELPSTSEGQFSEYFRDDFDYIVIEPKPDDKATVKFYKDSLKFPVGAPINNWKNKSVAEALQALGDIDPSKAQQLRVAGVQYWVNGNSYVIAQGPHKGETSHYKDLKLVQATL